MRKCVELHSSYFKAWRFFFSRKIFHFGDQRWVSRVTIIDYWGTL